MRPVKVIHNPIAGRGYGARVEPDIRRHLDAEGLEFDLVHTTGPWHAAELAQRAVSDGFELVAAAGGDGTVNEVLNGLMAASGEGEVGTLGVIPVGSGSDFAKGMGVTPDLAGACHRLAHGQTRMVDVGRVTLPGRPPRHFGNVVGIGFDGTVLLETLKMKRLRGLALYLLAVLKTVFLTFGAPWVTIEYDGRELNLQALMVCVANGAWEGGGFFIAPGAEPDDGLFDLCIARRVSRLTILALIPHFLRGTHVHREPIKMARADRVTVSSPDDLIAHVDGELLCTDAHRLEFEILPRRLRLRC